MLHSCTHMATVVFKGLSLIDVSNVRYMQNKRSRPTTPLNRLELVRRGFGKYILQANHFSCLSL